MKVFFQPPLPILDVTYGGLNAGFSAAQSELTAMSYFKHHVFICCNERDSDEVACNDYGSKKIREYAKERVRWRCA